MHRVLERLRELQHTKTGAKMPSGLPVNNWGSRSWREGVPAPSASILFSLRSRGGATTNRCQRGRPPVL
jgi:hypothetical protein